MELMRNTRLSSVDYLIVGPDVNMLLVYGFVNVGWILYFVGFIHLTLDSTLLLHIEGLPVLRVGRARCKS